MKICLALLALVAAGCSPPPRTEQSCSGPKDCTAAAPICCGQLDLGPGTGSNCQVASATAKCAASCVPSLSIPCGGSGNAVLCQAPADCAGFATVPRCCAFSNGFVSVSLCTNDAGVPAAAGCLN